MHRDSNRVRCAFFLFYRPNETEVRPTGKYRYLTFEDRKKIEAWHLIGDRPADIAARLSVHYTTIYKELQRGATGTLDRNQREGYSAELAERRLRESFKRRGKKRATAETYVTACVIENLLFRMGVLASVSLLSCGEMSKDGTPQVPPFELSPLRVDVARGQ